MLIMIAKATFVGSFNNETECPKVEIPEFAFIGRSNVGKSSLINLVTNRKDLAKTSQTPGKTQKLNFFLIDDTWHLVDLPGYGYAKVSKTMRSDFEKMIQYYFKNREQLYCTFLLIDASISPQKMDIEFANWLGQHQVPFVIVFTKVDKAKALEIKKNIDKFNGELLQTWTTLPQSFKTSSERKIGQRELMDFIQLIVKESKNQPSNTK